MSKTKRNESYNKTPLNVFAIFFFITLFLVLTLNTFKVLPWGIWGILWRFWPIFFIMAILQYLSRKKFILSFIVTGLGIGIIVSISFFSTASTSDKFAASLIRFNPYINKLRNTLGLEPGDKIAANLKLENDINDINQREIKISIAAGEFNLTDNQGPEHLIANSQYYQEFGKPDLTYRIEDGILKINFETQRNLKPLFGVAQDTKYDISIGHPDLTTNLILDAGATVFEAKFQNTKIKSLKINIGAGSSKVSINKDSLPSESFSIDVGAGTLKLILPFDAYLKINYIVGAGVLYIDNKKFIRNGSFTTANFGISEDPTIIDVTIGAGTIFIDASGKI